MKLFNLVLFITIVITLIGCAPQPIRTIETSGIDVNIVCIDNVEYIYWSVGSTGYASAHFKVDGSLYTCE